MPASERVTVADAVVELASPPGVATVTDQPSLAADNSVDVNTDDGDSPISGGGSPPTSELPADSRIADAAARSQSGVAGVAVAKAQQSVEAAELQQREGILALTNTPTSLKGAPALPAIGSCPPRQLSSLFRLLRDVQPKLEAALMR